MNIIDNYKYVLLQLFKICLLLDAEHSNSFFSGVNMLMESRRSDPFLGIRNTRLKHVSHSIKPAYALMDLDAISFTMKPNCWPICLLHLQLDQQYRRHSRIQCHQSPHLFLTTVSIRKYKLIRKFCHMPVFYST